LRADHLGCYGYERNTSPNLDAFAADAVFFANAFTPEVWTLTAHMTMLTGLSPEGHGLTPNLNLSESITTLPERLQRAGFATGGFVGHAWWLKGSRGFARGFDRYDVPDDYRPVEETHRVAVESWLVNQVGRPFFLFLHNYDIHSKPRPEGAHGGPVVPYDAESDTTRIFTSGLAVPSFQRPDHPEAIATLFLAAHNAGDLEATPEEQSYLVDAYDDCVVKVDQALGGLFGLLRAIPYHGSDSIYEQALIIVTADHGESLGDHGRHIHGNVYEENVRVPLLVKFPKQAYAGTVVETMAGLADLAPTVLEVLELEPLAQSDGLSLVGAASGGPVPERTLFLRRGTWRAVRTSQHKLLREIGAGFAAGYDMVVDPFEASPESNIAVEPYASLAAQLNAYYFPPRTGWQISLSDTTSDLRVAFTIESEAVLVAVQATRGHFIEETRSLDGNRHIMGGAIQFTSSYTDDTLAVRTEPPGAPITVTLETSHPVSNALAPDTPPGTTVVLKLDRADLANPRPVVGIGPAVSATYIEGATHSGEATMSDDEKAALEALGYLEGNTE